MRRNDERPAEAGRGRGALTNATSNTNRSKSTTDMSGGGALGLPRHLGIDPPPDARRLLPAAITHFLKVCVMVRS